MGVMQNLAVFLSTLPQPCRLSYLPLIHDILYSTNPFNWRFRQCIAVQLPELIQLPQKVDVFRTLYPLVMVLLQDPVYHVRRDSFRGVAALVKCLSSQVDNKDEAMAQNVYDTCRQNFQELKKSINSLVEGNNYQVRSCSFYFHLASSLENSISLSFSLSPTLFPLPFVLYVNVALKLLYIRCGSCGSN